MEPTITINGTELSEAQAIVVRCAIAAYESTIADEGLGDDEHGKRMSEAYLDRCKEINDLILDTPEPVRKHVQTSGGICRGCGGFTTYTRQNSKTGFCFKCEHDGPPKEIPHCPKCGSHAKHIRLKGCETIYIMDDFHKENQ